MGRFRVGLGLRDETISSVPPNKEPRVGLDTQSPIILEWNPLIQPVANTTALPPHL